MTEPRDIDTEEANENPDEVIDDGLGVPVSDPIDPTEVDEEDDEAPPAP